MEALDKQYADVLSSLKESKTPKKFGLKYVQKLAKRSTCSYVVPDEVSRISQNHNVHPNPCTLLFKVMLLLSARNSFEFLEENACSLASQGGITV